MLLNNKISEEIFDSKTKIEKYNTVQNKSEHSVKSIALSPAKSPMKSQGMSPIKGIMKIPKKLEEEDEQMSES